MKNKEWAFTDKSGWPSRGEWDNEPDKVQFITQSGLPGLIVRNGSGALCGYVGIGKAHPLHGMSYSACTLNPKCEEETYCEHSPEYLFSVHGGITFADVCQENREHGICHIPEEGEEEPLFWFGFDCSHAGDVSPSYDGLFGPSSQGMPTGWGGVYQYRNIEYVKKQIESLAKQLTEYCK